MEPNRRLRGPRVPNFKRTEIRPHLKDPSGREVSVVQATSGFEDVPFLVSVEEAARLLGIGRTTCYGLVMNGALKSVKIGRRRLVLRSSIEEYARNLGEDGDEV
jgi:excisionase family DNA binding protein